MSDTGGGHRASATALRDGFEVLYGDKYEINVVDLWSSSSPWPLCNMPKSYFFLVKYPWLWRLSFRTSEPELLHEAMFAVYPVNIASWRSSGSDVRKLRRHSQGYFTRKK